MTHAQVAPSCLDVDAVIINFNSGQLLRGLLHSLERAQKLAEACVRLRVIIVDNASSDESALAVVPIELNATWIRPECNLGFGAAANLGATGSRAQWLLLLNPDIRLSEEFLADLPNQIGGLPGRAGILGPALINADGSHQPSVGRFPTLLRTLIALARRRSQRKYVPRHRHRASVVDWVTGACLLVRRDCWQRLRGFDERYFLYYEDVDLCKRARDVGIDTVYLPPVHATHLFPTAQRGLPTALVPVIRRSQIQWFQLHRSAAETRLLGWLVRAWARCGALGLGRRDVDWGEVRESVRLDIHASSSPKTSVDPSGLV